MKYLFLLSLHIFVAVSLCAQWDPIYSGYKIDFEDEDELFRIVIDTIPGKENSWQIGKPQKPFINSAYSPENALITDTLSSYPNNDSSVFRLIHVPQEGFPNFHTVSLSGYYKVDCDSLSDYGKIEFSPDNGKLWIDLLDSTIISDYRVWAAGVIPVLTGKSDWMGFQANLVDFAYDYTIGDTVQFRFTFISDGKNEEGRDGLAFDDFIVNDFTESIRLSDSRNTVIFPNPANEIVTIQNEKHAGLISSLEILNSCGQMVCSMSEIERNKVEIDVSGLSPGLYVVRMWDMEENNGYGTFIVY